MAIHRKIVLVSTMARVLRATVEVLQPQATADGLRQVHPQHLDTVDNRRRDRLQRLGLMVGELRQDHLQRLEFMVEDLHLGHHQHLEAMDMQLENLKDSQHNSIEGNLPLHHHWLPPVHRR